MVFEKAVADFGICMESPICVRPQNVSCLVIGKGFGYFDSSSHLDVEHWLAFQDHVVLQRRDVFAAMVSSCLLKLVRGLHEPHDVSSCFQIVKPEIKDRFILNHRGPNGCEAAAPSYCSRYMPPGWPMPAVEVRRFQD